MSDRNTDETPQQIAERMERKFFRIPSEPVPRYRAIANFVIGAAECAVIIPVLFYLRFGSVGDLGWGLTVFFVAYCLLTAIALFFRPITSFHTVVPMRGDWRDRIGAFWLVACAFGPFLGWVVVKLLPVTAESWRWVYGTRVVLTIGLPLLTSLPLFRYAKGRAAYVAIPILVCVTMLPVWSGLNTALDLMNGVQGDRLVYTERVLWQCGNNNR